MNTYMIFTVWRIGGRTVIDVGNTTEVARNPTEAKEKAHRRGIGWGNGYRSDYVGLAAVFRRPDAKRYRTDEQDHV